MGLFIKELFINENDYTFLYQAESVVKMTEVIKQTMLQRGYRSIGDNVFEKGNGILRMVLGAFYKHYKMEITAEAAEDNHVKVAIRKKSSGFAGGAIGMSQIQKELAALKTIFVSL